MSAASWRVTVNTRECIGSGLCAGIAPGYFDVVGGRSRPPAAPVSPDDDLLDAVQCCPTEAIAIFDATTGEPVYGPADEPAGGAVRQPPVAH